MQKFISILVAGLFLLLPAAAGAGNYHIDHRSSLEGDQGWDLLTLDEANNRLYITRGTEVDVMDLSKEKIVGKIKDIAGAHGVALAQEYQKGFITNGRAGTVTSFDLKTNSALNQIKVGDKPDAIIYDDFSHRVFVFNAQSQDITVLDAEKDSVLKTIPLSGKPEFAVSDGKGTVFVNLEDKNSLTAIDAERMKIRKKWSLKPCESPSGLAIDRETHRLFSVCENETMVVLNSETGKIITTVPIGKKPDAAAFDPSTRLAFSSNGEGTLTVVQEKTPDQFEVVSNVATQKGARTLALNTKYHVIYLITAKFEEPEQPTPSTPHPRPKIIPGTVELLVLKDL